MNPLPPRSNQTLPFFATIFSFQNHVPMFKFTLTVWISLLFSLLLQAQTGCPGCAVMVPAGLPADTVFLPDLPDGTAGSLYNEDISFRLPKTTTPVNAIDSTTPPGLTISKFEIVSIDGLPPGMYWQPNKFNFDMSTETDGCIKICGTPSTSDSFELIVTLKATVLFFAQEATFPLSLYIAPKVSNTDGFSLTNPEGCGSTTVTFTNNVPSGGASGFTYEWDFGDGSPVFTGENPPPHTYDQVGQYAVSYHAIVDTAGFILESIRVLEVDCVDELGIGSPDLFLQILAPNNGNIIYDSSPDVNNTPLPYTFPVGINLGMGNYTLKVIDEDSGLKGNDDNCGIVSFNLLSGDTIFAGGLTVVLNILHPVEEITSKDTVIVYPQPAPPTLSTPNGAAACVGETNLVLVSSYGSSNQWLLNGSTISGATDFIYQPTQSGYFQAKVTTQYGCVAISDSTFIEFYPLPVPPVWYNYNNSLRLYDTAALPTMYALQWYAGTNPIPGETGIWYCTMVSGNFGLEVTDLATGCASFYANLVENNPLFDCTIGTAELDNSQMSIAPNPASEKVQVQLKNNTGNGVLHLWDVTGRLLFTEPIRAGQDVVSLDLRNLRPGLFVVELVQDKRRSVGKLVVAR
jgi:hypothetical protein